MSDKRLEELLEDERRCAACRHARRMSALIDITFMVLLATVVVLVGVMNC